MAHPAPLSRPSSLGGAATAPAPRRSAPGAYARDGEHRQRPQALLAAICFAGIPITVVIGEIVKALS